MGEQHSFFLLPDFTHNVTLPHILAATADAF